MLLPAQTMVRLSPQKRVSLGNGVQKASKIYFSSISSGTKWSSAGFLIAGPEFLLTGTKFCISEETGAGKLWFFSERKERMFKKLRRFQKTHLQLRKSIFRKGTEKGPMGN